jgi:CHAT domain-containing protein/dienelactone hydrolase
MRNWRSVGLLTAVVLTVFAATARASPAGTAINFSSLDKNQPYKLSGTLYLPENSSAPCPAVVIIHGTLGIDARGAFYREPLLDEGMAIFEVDFKTGIYISAFDRPRPTSFVPMAYAALKELRKLPAIDPNRIAIMGFSLGGAVAMRTSMENYRKMWMGEEKGFAAHVAFYPVSKPFMAELEKSGSKLTGAPTIIFYGTEDSYGEGKAVPELKRLLSKKYTFEVTTVEYPGATHAFNLNAPPAHFADRAAIGGKVYTAWDADAANDSLTKVVAFLRQTLGAKTIEIRDREASSEHATGEGRVSATVQDQSSSPLQDRITQHEQKLAQARAARQAKSEELELTILGGLYRQTGNLPKALEYCNEALSLEQSTGNHGGEAMTKDAIGRIYTDMGEEKKALDLFNEILPYWQSRHNRRHAALAHKSQLLKLGEASTLNNMGRVYNNLGQKPKALEYLNQALPIWQELGNRSGEASTLDNMGRTYADMGQGQQALQYFNRALTLWRADNELGGEGLTLVNMGKVYADLGQKQNALESYNHALANWRKIGNREGEADALEYMGKLYGDLGQDQRALEYLNQALPLWRETGNRSGEALALNDIGRIYFNLREGQKTLEYLNQALPIWRETGNRRGEAVTLNGIGIAYSELGEKSKALEFDEEALPIWREVKDRRGEAFALGSIGRAYSHLGQQQKALPYNLAALSLAKAAGDPDLQGGAETSLMIDFSIQNRPEEAIFFGTEAVNSYQQIRKNISGLEEDLQTGFAKSKSATYRMLAELLVQADRLGEAEQVLDLLKEQELQEVVRGATASAEAKVEPLKLTGAQQQAESGLAAAEKTALALTDTSTEYAELLAKATRTPGEDARLKLLETKIEAGNGEVSDFFKRTLYPELAQKASTQNANALLSREKSEVSRLQNTLAQLGPRVLGIRLLLGDQNAYAILVTANARKKLELKVTPVELRRKVLQVRDDLRNPASDPKPHLAELYAMVVAPFADELTPLERTSAEKGRVPTLLWSLDGAMRYLPMAALYDGHQYMVERFNNVLFTPESYGHMAPSSDANSPGLHVLAMGLSKSYGGLPALPGVLPELDAVVHDPSVPESHGPMDGLLLPNERFTYAALEKELGTGSSFPVVHIASHFVLELGSGEEPYLMLGGESTGRPEGYQLTLSKLEDSTISFHGTRLLTLSACSTAKGDVANDGLEMDSLGMIAQQKDAEAVLATLWDVNDASTSRIMSDFYARWVKDPGDGKAEALRQAQLALLREPAPSSPTPHAADYSHPFYWAPFVLIGNYQ